MTESEPAVFKAFSAAMNDVKGVGKNSRANVGGGYNFRGVDAVLNAVGPAFRTHGVFAVPFKVDLLTDERVAAKNGGMMHNITLGITWRVYGPDGSFFDGYSAGESFDSGDKATAKAHSVAYRTFLLQALCLPTDEPDPDAEAYERAQAAQAATPTARVMRAAQGAFTSEQAFKEFAIDAIGTDRIDQLTEDEASELIDKINAKGKN